ncbi:CASTOR/POLLUX-related putative ion channel [Streptomyces sp. NBC_00859]|uniref:CASTOR/POLLUX-related putative ion channel n=1 Tax=Streptomyces sp. NBC_00859 TaxID=2903682 RepID=UPI0038676FBC|nr:NAD-binding lipoprotein [Streptomyces sp. NBC_00859]
MRGRTEARIRTRLRYWFDNFLARSTLTLVACLTLACLAVVIPASVAQVLVGRPVPVTLAGQAAAVWTTVGATLRIGGAVGAPSFVVLSVLLALVSLLFVSTLVSVITTGMNDKILELRLGRSTIVEQRHTVVLGWSDQVFPVISELVTANAHRRRATVALLAPRDKVQMEEEITTKVGATGTTRVVCRSGSPTDPAVLARVSPHTAAAVIVLSPGDHEGDRTVVRTLLALGTVLGDAASTTVVAAVREPCHHTAAVLAAGPGGRVLDIDAITARLLAQCSRQPGLSLVHQELLEFAGSEFHTVQEPALTGRTYGEALLSYARSCVVGLLRPDGRPALNPPASTVITAGDRIVLITEDDTTAIVSDEPFPFDENVIVVPAPRETGSARMLLMGWNRRAPLIIDQLARYVGPDSRLDLVPGGPWAPHDLHVLAYDSVIVLGSDAAGSVSTADSDYHVLETLLHLRAAEQAAGRSLHVVAELSDDRNRLIAPMSPGADFVVSGRLISLLMTQISENPRTAALFEELFTAGGNRIHLGPAADYVPLGPEVAFADVVASGRRCDRSVIGYRLHAGSGTGPRFGVRVNPDKDERVVFGDADTVIAIMRDR